MRKMVLRLIDYIYARQRRLDRQGRTGNYLNPAEPSSACDLALV